MSPAEYERRAKLKREIRAAKRPVKPPSMVDYRAHVTRLPPAGSGMLGLVMAIQAMKLRRRDADDRRRAPQAG